MGAELPRGADAGLAGDRVDLPAQPGITLLVGGGEGAGDGVEAASEARVIGERPEFEPDDNARHEPRAEEGPREPRPGEPRDPAVLDSPEGGGREGEGDRKEDGRV